MAHVAGAVFVGGTSCASTNPIHVLVAFGRVLSKIDPGAKHAADVGVSLVKALVDDGIDERRTWQEKFLKSGEGHIHIKDFVLVSKHEVLYLSLKPLLEVSLKATSYCLTKFYPGEFTI